MTKPEPLKRKENICKNCGMSLEDCINAKKNGKSCCPECQHFGEFHKQDVKSALQGLIEEIRLTDLEWVVYSDGSQKRMSEKERKEIIIEFIKKWFPDVVKDD